MSEAAYSRPDSTDEAGTDSAVAILAPRTSTAERVLRIVVPSLNNQFVNLIKNTSIAIAVGYSDLMSVGGTIINQTFRPLEVMAITMAIYLVLCLCLASALNAWNEKLRRREGRSGRS